MTTVIIGFDLDKEGASYSAKNKELSDAIIALSGIHWRILDSTWIVVADLSARQIRDQLAPHVDTNSKLLVVETSNVGAWQGFNAKGDAWLHKNL